MFKYWGCCHGSGKLPRPNLHRLFCARKQDSVIGYRKKLRSENEMKLIKIREEKKKVRNIVDLMNIFCW